MKIMNHLNFLIVLIISLFIAYFLGTRNKKIVYITNQEEIKALYEQITALSLEIQKLKTNDYIIYAWEWNRSSVKKRKRMLEFLPYFTDTSTSLKSISPYKKIGGL